MPDRSRESWVPTPPALCRVSHAREPPPTKRPTTVTFATDYLNALLIKGIHFYFFSTDNVLASVLVIFHYIELNVTVN